MLIFTTSEQAVAVPSIFTCLETWLLIGRTLFLPAIRRVGSLGVITKATRTNTPNHDEANIADDAVVVVVVFVVAGAADPF